MKSDSATTGLRVVYYASCKMSSGIPLNHSIMVGPAVQYMIEDITLRFCKH